MMWFFHCGFSRLYFSLFFLKAPFWFLACLREQFGYLLLGVSIRENGEP